MEVTTYITLSSEMRINTQLNNTLTTYIKSNLLTKRLVLLPVDWDKNCLLFTKQLYMRNNNIGYT